jgi:hypothetical protein
MNTIVNSPPAAPGVIMLRIERIKMLVERSEFTLGSLRSSADKVFGPSPPEVSLGADDKISEGYLGALDHNMDTLENYLSLIQGQASRFEDL